MEYIAVITSKDNSLFLAGGYFVQKNYVQSRVVPPDKRGAAKDERCSASDKRSETRVDCRRSVS